MQAIWIVQKQLEYFPEKPLFVIGVLRRAVMKDKLPGGGERERDLALQQKCVQAVELENSWWLFVLNHRPRAMKQLFVQVEGSRVA